MREKKWLPVGCIFCSVILCVCVCVRVRVRARVRAQACMCAHALCMWRSEDSSKCWSLPSTCFNGRISVGYCCRCQANWTTSFWDSPVSTFSVLPWAEITDIPYCFLFYAVLGISIQVVKLMQQGLFPTKPSLQPHSHSFRLFNFPIASPSVGGHRVAGSSG